MIQSFMHRHCEPEGRGNPFLFFSIGNGLLCCTLSVLLAMTMILLPCQAAIDFDGVDDSIDIIDSDTQDLLSSFSISAWAKSTGATQYAFIFGTADAADLNGYYITIHDASQKAIVYSCDAATCSSAAGTTNIKNDNIWHHLVGTFNGTNLDIYVDQIKEGSTATTRTPTNNIFTQRIGGSHFGSRNFKGEIDDIRIYNRALSSPEVEALYKAKRKRIGGSLSNGLVAHYEMDDDEIGAVAAQAQDRSGNLNHGEFVGFDNLTTALSKDVPPNVGTGTSLEFDGVDDNIDLTDNLMNNSDLASGTVATWIKVNSTGSLEYPISLEGVVYIATSASSEFDFQLYDSSSSVLNGGAFTADQWYFLAQTWNGSTQKIYIDGNKIKSASQSSPTFDSFSRGWKLGSRFDSINFFNGSIDDTYIYNKELSISEISFLYNGSGLDPGTSNLQALWTFDDDSAVKDSSGNDNHGLGIGGVSLKYTEGVLRR